MPCFSEPEWPRPGPGWRCNGPGADVRWVDPDELDDLNPALARGRTLGGSYAPGDGYIDPPRNVLAYTTALFTSGVHVLEGAAFTGLVRTGDRVTGVLSSPGEIATGRVVLTGGPSFRPRSVAPPASASRSAAPGTRRVVTEPILDLTRRPAADGVRRGVRYLLAARGGRGAVGPSNPDEKPGEATEFDWGYYDKVRSRVAALLPVTADLGLRKAWAATIDFTPDHLPILGPALTLDGPVLGTSRRGRGRHDDGAPRSPGPRPTSRCTARPTSWTSPTSAWTASTSTAAAGWRRTRSRCRSPSTRVSQTDPRRPAARVHRPRPRRRDAR